MAHFFTRNVFAVRVMMDVAEGHRDLQLNGPHISFPITSLPATAFSFAAAESLGLEGSEEL